MDVIQSSYLVMTTAMAVSLVVYGYYTMQQRSAVSEERRGFLFPNYMILGSLVAITVASAISVFTLGGVEVLPIRTALETVFAFGTGAGLLWIIGRRSLLIVYTALFAVSVATETVYPYWLYSTSYLIWIFSSMIVAFAPVVMYIFVYRAAKTQGRSIRSLFLALMLNYYAIVAWNIIVTGGLWSGELMIAYSMIQPLLATVVSMFVTFTALMLVAVCIGGKASVGWFTVAYAFSFLGVFANIFLFSLITVVSPATAIVAVLIEGGTIQWILNGWHAVERYQENKKIRDYPKLANRSSLLLGVALIASGMSSFLYLYVSTTTAISALAKTMIVFTLIADVLIAVSVATARRFLAAGVFFAILASVPAALLVSIPEIESTLFVSAIAVLALTMAPSFTLLKARGTLSGADRSKMTKIASSILLLGLAQLAFLVFALPSSALPPWAVFVSEPGSMFLFVIATMFVTSAMVMYDALRTRPLKPIGIGKATDYRGAKTAKG